MAIPISKYISIQNKVLNTVIGDRDFSALVFSKTAMKTGATGQKKTDYEASKVISLTKGEVGSYFDSTFKTYLDQYFAYTGGTKRPAVINLALVGADETAGDAFARITGGTSTIPAFNNFGAFAFYGTFSLGSEGDEGLLDVAIANEGNEFGWVFVVKTDTTNQATDSAALEGKMLTHLTHDDIDVLSWYASVDYDKANAAGTIDYKQFPNTDATVTTASGKTTADGLKVNYIGLVQTYGSGMKFYQKGVNMDGTDLGVVRDMCWINSEIVKGYFNLQTNSQKVPANYVGCAMVRNIIIGVATRAIDNGVILLEKPLDTTQIALVNQYAGNDFAADEVQSAGYYIDVKIVKDGNDYKCEYTLIYAKGDHIVKVDGLHVLV